MLLTRGREIATSPLLFPIEIGKEIVSEAGRRIVEAQLLVEIVVDSAYVLFGQLKVAVEVGPNALWCLRLGYHAPAVSDTPALTRTVSAARLEEAAEAGDRGGHEPSATCAPLLLYFSPISTSTGSSTNLPRSLPYVSFWLPKGLYWVTWMLC